MGWQRLAKFREWNSEISHREEKEAVAERLAARVRDGEVLGVGSGSSAFLALLAIAERVEREGIRVATIPTSHEVGLACAACGLPTTSLTSQRPDWGFDGADEVDANHRLIKGRGGAMFREKLVMACSAKTIILVDDSKRVERLGERFAVPVEANPQALHLVEEKLLELGAIDVVLRPAVGKDGPVITETSNVILDARFGQIGDEFETKIEAIPGVTACGLFIGYPVEILTP